MLTLEGVVAGYGGGDVLQGVDITVERGSVACIANARPRATASGWRNGCMCSSS